MHHLLYKRKGRRTAVSHVHRWLGRALITLGAINGGLGLQLAANAPTGWFIAYGVVAGVVYLVYAVVVAGTAVGRRRRGVNGDGGKGEKAVSEERGVGGVEE